MTVMVVGYLINCNYYSLLAYIFYHTISGPLVSHPVKCNDAFLILSGGCGEGSDPRSLGSLCIKITNEFSPVKDS